MPDLMGMKQVLVLNNEAHHCYREKPVAEDIARSEMPVFRNLWENIRNDMPKKGRASGGTLDPLLR